MHNKITELLKKYTNHNTVELTSRGNTAIFAALYCARKINLGKKTVLIPDQGGWLTYLRYPKMLELDIIKVKTDCGIIDLNELKDANKKISIKKLSLNKNIKNNNYKNRNDNNKLINEKIINKDNNLENKQVAHNVNKLSNKISNNNVCCLIYQNPAGYFAEQQIKEIYDICRKNNCLVILDASGSIGDKEFCNGNYADFIIGSFGKWKPVNLGYGGFISIKNKEHYEKAKEIFNTTSFNKNYYPLLLNKLKNIKNRYDLFYKTNKKIKNELKNFNIIHKNKKGINVIVKFKNEKEKQKIIEYCEKNKYEFTLCPKYIRVNENAVSIEVKRL